MAGYPTMNPVSSNAQPRQLNFLEKTFPQIFLIQEGMFKGEPNPYATPVLLGIAVVGFVFWRKFK